MNGMNEELEKVEIKAPANPPKRDSFFSELIKFALIAVVIVIPIRLYIAQPFIVSGSSMDPTFENGEYLIVDELSYRFDDPARGDIVIFRYPKNPSKFFIKRIIGLPGETVNITHGQVSITNEKHPDGIKISEPYIVRSSSDDFSMTLNDTEYFVMGDNRPASSDSRIWGSLDRHFIVGKALLRLFPVNRLDVLPGGIDAVMLGIETN